MARAIVGGLLFSTVISLVFLPSIYVALNRLRLVPGRVLRWIGSRLLRGRRRVGIGA